MMTLPKRVTICEVGPRDGFQIEAEWIPTETKVKVIDRLAETGLPLLEDGRAVYQGSPGEMADYARRLVAAGVRIVGGCCGSAPAHLRAMAEALALAP